MELNGWITWMRDFASVAEVFALEETSSFGTSVGMEILAVRSALYARTLTLFEGTLLLVENDRQLDFRVHSRGVIEAVMYLVALEKDSDLVERMKEDDYKNRLGRAKLHLDALRSDDDEEARQALEEFLAAAEPAKKLGLDTLLKGSQFDRLYRSYRGLCADAVHVSMTSLERHFSLAGDTIRLNIHPALDAADMHHTMVELGISVVLATLVLMKTREKTETWDRFVGLLTRYRELQDETRPQDDKSG